MLRAMLLCASLLGSQVSAASFTGRWVADLSSQKLPEHPDVYLVADGHYECRSCSPPRSYPADGKPHAIPGDQEVTSESVTVLSRRSIRTRIVSPSLIRTTTMTASADDRTARYVSQDRRPGVKGVLRTRYIARRVAPAPKEANRVSGSWQGIAYLEVPRQLRTIALRLAGNRLSYSTPTGVSYSAIVGGPAAPVRGPYAGAITASVRRVGRHTLVETRLRDGKPLFERTFQLSRDGKSLEISTRDESNGTTFVATSHRG
jgi:hypothetical protein